MYFPAEHFQTKLQLTTEELRDFERRGVIQGVVKAGRTFYSSRDLYRLKGILFFMRTHGLPLEKAQERVDTPAAVTAPSGSRK